MDIPVFHDDQHGTAIVCCAALLNALELQGKKIEDIKMVINGAGSAGIACAKMFLNFGLKFDNLIMCDTNGTITKRRGEKTMNFIKYDFRNTVTEADTLEEACKGADVIIGLSRKGAFTKEIVESLAEKPIIFAMANPDPEILPEDAKAIRDDIIIATGRSDYPNQVNNVMCFPFIFRAALDVRATEINEEMKSAAVKALAQLVKDSAQMHKSVGSSDYEVKDLVLSPDYIIPSPFDPRLITEISIAVAKAAMDSGVAKKPIEDFNEYRRQLIKIQVANANLKSN